MWTLMSSRKRVRGLRGEPDVYTLHELGELRELRGAHRLSSLHDL